ncbi:hypothetical protein HGRIS_007693 [Hohenbuehelia grisea]|uniref:NAD(P)-binding protein n=1 Tax=Hohenbuehelia grisea TaxID=104357 RepID=A0ABR3J616_9AGAR
MPSLNDSKCILVTGATAGIGRVLALRIKDLPSKPKVIVTGRRKERLDELASQGFETVQVDLDTDKTGIKKFVDGLLAKYPDLDAAILNAGKQVETWWTATPEKPVDLDSLASEMNVNYTSIVATITYLLPHFHKLASEGKPTIIAPVTSGLVSKPQRNPTRFLIHSMGLLRASSLDLGLRTTLPRRPLCIHFASPCKRSFMGPTFMSSRSAHR